MAKGVNRNDRAAGCGRCGSRKHIPLPKTSHRKEEELQKLPAGACGACYQIGDEEKLIQLRKMRNVKLRTRSSVRGAVRKVTRSLSRR